jgi:peptide methionine sulfoxide reductase msrA/msrB
MKKTLVLAGGCFWCVEHDMRKVDGVSLVVSGYSGATANSDSDIPTYENHKGYKEAVEVTYDSEQTSYKKLLQWFIDHIDPTDNGGQFGDRGESYQTAIYYKNEDEKHIAEGVLNELDESNVYENKSVVSILPEMSFYTAEEYHQNYSEKNPLRYGMYRQGSGREDFVQKTCQIRDEKHVNWKE